MGIQAEDHVQLWKILRNMKMTHLAVELCSQLKMSSQNLSELHEKFVHLKALHLAQDEQSSCKFDDQHVVLLSHFPSLTCCLLDEVPYQCSDIMKNIVRN